LIEGFFSGEGLSEEEARAYMVQDIIGDYPITQGCKFDYY